MSGYALVLPEILLLAGVIWAMFGDKLPGKDRGTALVGVAFAAFTALTAAAAPLGGSAFGHLFLIDAPARFIRTAAAVLLALWLLWTWKGAKGRIREGVAMAMLSAMGTLLLAASQDLIMIYVALELSTMPAYALIGYRRGDIKSLEGALKYFLLSMLTSLVMVYGFSFLLGVTGTTALGQMDLTGTAALGILAVLLSLVGIFAKLSAVPFHYWAPDAYEGSDPWTVAFVSVVPKLGGAIILARLTSALAPSMPQMGMVIAIAAAASMILGNLSAMQQTDIRRLMAYSGVAHAGYLMLGIAAVSDVGYLSGIFYALAYSVPSLGIMLIAAKEGSKLDDLAGLSQRNPVVAWSGVIMLLSLIGIPPMVGLFGKLYMFTAAIDGHLIAFVVIAVIMSAMSAYYYLRIVKAMFAVGSDNADEPVAPAGFSLTDGVVVTVAAVTLALGIFAGPLLGALGA